MLSGMENIIMKSIWRLEKTEKRITVYDIIQSLKENYEKKYSRATIRTYLTKLEKKGFIRLKWEGRYSYISSLVEEKAYQKKQLENMKEFWFDDSLSDMICAFTETISQEEAEELKDLVDKLRD
ncbi:CopY family transcriptional regulator [Hungatella hathewayi]|nr:CopY family transcriptional regulator [Hungatella hathewayi]